MPSLYSFFRTLLLLTVVGIAFAWGALAFVLHNHRIDLSILERYDTDNPSMLLDDAGNEWGRFQRDWRKPIQLIDMPNHLINAFIAAEDWAFFSHNGISWKGIIRSTLVNLYHGRMAQGASTITQQLVRLLFFDTAKTFRRKIKEQFMALVVERQCTKEQILETYLNHVYFGCGIYGVEAACQRFWSKSARDVTVDEAAMLAAVMRSPACYCPLLNPLSACRRRNIVLLSMHKLGFIDTHTYATAVDKQLVVNERYIEPCAPHLHEHLRIVLEDLVGKTTLYTGGLIIQTTLNKKIQADAEREFRKQCTLLKQQIDPSVDGGLITLDVNSGAVKALVGGADFKHSKFNRALQARRQMGSTIKPVMYAMAIQQGASFADVALDEPMHIEHNKQLWSPKNVYNTFEGEMTLARALSRSNNIIAIKTLMNVGYQPIITTLQTCGIAAPLKPYPSLALGCVDTTVKEVAGMFNIFANHGVYVEPYAIQWIKDRWGTKIWRAQQQHTIVLPSLVTDQVAKVLEISLNRIKQFMTQPWIDSAAISKTGTTNDWRTCWFVGSTPELTTALYIGRDDNKPMGTNMYPLRTAFPIWLGIHAQQHTQRKEFAYDARLQLRFIDEWTGKQRADAHDPSTLAIFVDRYDL